MADKLKPARVANALAITAGIVSIVCALLLAIAPQFSMNLFGSIFHGLDVSNITVALTWGRTILGTVVAIVLAWIFGWLYAVIYNKL